MATLALAAAGAAAGSALLPTGISVLGVTLSGAALGAQAGSLAGSFLDGGFSDKSLSAASGQARTFRGPRLTDLHVTSSTEGAPIPRLYGRARLGGQVIWAAPFDEQVITTTSQQGTAGGSSGGGKGGRSGGGNSGSGSGGTVTQIEYRYFSSFAVALCEGQISGIGRVWANGSELDLSQITYRVYNGTDEQQPDALIVARQGGASPAYRGTAYVVFEQLALAPFGNRLPQLSFEVNRPVDEVNREIRGVVVIPGSGEFAYAPEPITRLGSGATRVYENVHTRQGGTDWSVALDQLEAALPNARSASLVVSWFGTDLRAGQCQVKPGVEIAGKDTYPASWSVAGLARAEAHVVSLREGRPAYGGTPSDATVIAAIGDLKARGISVTLTPFILMDVPAGNSLPNPYDGASTQPAYPWRGRITLDPAPGQAGSPDKTTAAKTQIASFVGTAQPSDFAVSDGAVVYSGPDEWSLRRLILHCAWLAQAAGGVDAFLIGTELRGLTTARDGASSYPFVAALIALAADVKSILGSGTKVTYAADWSEYFGHQPADGSGDVHFHLDTLWASTNIDAIGIDLYWPLADWRPGGNHLDAVAGARSVYDLDYLKSNLEGGEGYDWYYASAADRASQTRTPITDGYGKPWVFRYKDLKAWWLNQHFNRPGGVETSSATAWVPQSKPFWLMEVGCPAVDLGANEPNVFVDPKSSESKVPHFSRGRRDDLMQRRYLQALIEAFDTSHPDNVAGLNPLSATTGAPMVDISRIHVYAWDARPYPAFPTNTSAWGDGENWRLGHWLNGRFSSAALANVVSTLLDDFGFASYDASRLEGVVGGYVVDRVMSAREALQPLELSYFFDAVESDGMIAFRHRGVDAPVAVLEESGLVELSAAAAPLTLARGQETELPAAAKVAYVSAAGDYRQAIAEARRVTSSSGRIAQAELAIVLEAEQANATAEAWLFEAWASRERASFALPPSLLAVEPGDMLALERGGRQRLYRVTDIGERAERQIEARSIDPAVYEPVGGAVRAVTPPVVPVAGQPVVELIDLPLLRGEESPLAGYAAVTQSPWPAGISFYSSPEATGYELRAVATAPTIMGRTQSALPPGVPSRIDRGSTLTVQIDQGQLASATSTQMLAGANTAAVRHASGEWEVLQFEEAELVATQTYALRRLLRGQAGTEAVISTALPAGARFVLLDAAVTRLDLAAGDISVPLNWRYGPSSRELGAESYAQQSHTFAGLGRRPLSPVHVRGTRSGGDLAIGWVRRTRTGGDPWEVVEVPLAEESELYEVDIMDGGTVKRTLTAASPAASYPAAQQLIDFGAVQPSVTVRVYQVSTSWGRGVNAEAVL